MSALQTFVGRRLVTQAPLYFTIAAVVAALLAVSACRGTKLEPAQVDAPWRTRPKEQLSEKSELSGAIPGTSKLLTPLSERVRFGPFKAERKDGALLAFISDAFGKSHIFTIPLLPDGLPSGPRLDTSLETSASLFALRALRTEGQAGAVAYGSALVTPKSADENAAFAVSYLPLDAQGRCIGKPAPVALTHERVPWIDVFALPGDEAVIAWAEENEESTATLMAATVSTTDGTVRVKPRALALMISSWQLRESPAGIAVAWISVGRSATGKKALLYTEFDKNLQARETPVAVSGAFGALRDIDFIRNGEQTTMVWLGQSAQGYRLLSASITDAGRVTNARLIPNVPVNAEVETLVGAGKDTLLVYRAKGSSDAGLFEVGYTYIGKGLHGQVTALRGVRDWAKTEHGFSFLYVGCEPTSQTCDLQARKPYMASINEELHVSHAVPLRQRFTAELSQAWALTCTGDGCQFIGTLETEAPELHAFSLGGPARARARQPDSTQKSKQTTPIMGSAPKAAVADTAPKISPTGSLSVLGTLARESTVVLPTGASAIAGAELETGALIAVVGDPRDGEPSALYTVYIAPDGTLAEPVRVATRAVPEGGVAIASALPAKNGAAIAWIANDDGDLQIHLTKVDAKGRRINETQVSASKGAAGAVSLVAIPGGYLAAWSDSRLGHPEVYAARFGADLRRLTKEERITDFGIQQDPALVREIRMRLLGPTAWVTFTSERPSTASTSVQIAQISTNNAARISVVVQVSEVGQSAAKPVFYDGEHGPGLCFATDAGARVMQAELNTVGALLRPPTALLESQATTVRALLTAPGFDRCLALRSAELSAETRTVDVTQVLPKPPGTVAGVLGTESQSAGTFGSIPKGNADAVLLASNIYTVERRGGAVQLVRRTLTP